MDTLVQDYRTGAMRDAGERFKKLVYQYDLISGKVNEVAYQPGKTDQFYHRYTYDAENRITQAQTSADSIVWERDAMYNYYMHGPLLRTQLGQYKVQGQDYAYTLQGWLKGINGVGELHEIGLDGTNAAANQFVAKDAYSLMLHYNNNDYSSILNTCYCVSNSVTLPATHSMKVLYNGNIAGMSLSIPKLQYPLKTPATRLGNMYYNYKYDQLNRLTRMDAYTRQLISQNSLVYSAALNSYKERVSYDPNGNILTYLRNGADSSSITGLPTGPLAMDSLKYKYYTKTNQLRQVTDNVSSGNYTEDIDNQSDTSNYVYDAIGNLIRDKHEGIDSIHWNVYGKIMSIHKSSGVNIYYTYDAGGNRISKAVLSSTGGIGGGPDTATTWYARDATGNVMSVYTVHRDTALQDELHLYGSSRLGILKPERNLKLAAQYGQYDTSVSILGTAHGSIFRRGMKFFELANHLGNVLVTISDKKHGYDAGADGNVDYYNPVVMSANDYYPFGMVTPGRKYPAKNGYRYGFNGKENDNEIKGEGNQQDYGMRIYDPRLGRFLSVDPLEDEYPWNSPYSFAEGDPINYIDLDGAEKSKSELQSLERQYSPRLEQIKANANLNLIALKGGADAVLNANTFGFTDWFGSTSNVDNYETGQEKEAYLLGRIGGDIAAGYQGLTEVGAGGTTAAAAGASGVGLAVGVGVAAHGAGVGATAASDIGWALKKLYQLNIQGTATTDATSSTNQQAQSAHQKNSNSANSNAAGNNSRQTTLEKNVEASKKSEDFVRQKLSKELKAGEEILEKPRIYIKGGRGKYSNPDFVIYNRRTDRVTRVVDAKNGNAVPSGNQKLLNERGGVLYGSRRYNIKRKDNRSVDKKKLETVQTNF